MALNMNATFESVAALLEEIAERQKKMDEQLQASKAEHDRMIAEMRAETAEIRAETKELSKNVGGLNRSRGDVAEGLMASDLREKFAALGLNFEYTIQNFEVKEKKTGRDLAEVDILLVNGTIALVVEAKTTMTRGDVDAHEERMDILRQAYLSLFG
jgi:hypothetical protein